MANVLAAGLRAFLRGDPVTEAMEEQTLADQRLLNRRLVILDTIITLAPLLGLLGTVLGMMAAFTQLATSEQVVPSDLAAGISQALVTTATGLILAVPVMVCYGFFRNRVMKALQDVGTFVTALMRR